MTTDTASRTDELSTYERLSERFETTFTDVRGGVEVTFISGEQVVRRLNEVLGVAGWSFRVVEHSINQEADEVWALGETLQRSMNTLWFGSSSARRRSAARAARARRWTWASI